MLNGNGATALPNECGDSLLCLFLPTIRTPKHDESRIDQCKLGRLIRVNFSGRKQLPRLALAVLSVAGISSVVLLKCAILSRPFVSRVFFIARKTVPAPSGKSPIIPVDSFTDELPTVSDCLPGPLRGESQQAFVESANCGFAMLSHILHTISRPVLLQSADLELIKACRAAINSSSSSMLSGIIRPSRSIRTKVGR